MSQVLEARVCFDFVPISIIKWLLYGIYVGVFGKDFVLLIKFFLLCLNNVDSQSAETQ